MSLPISVTYTFATATSSIPLSQLDANFTTVVNGINGIGNGTNALANVLITGGNATITTAVVTTGNISTINSNVTIAATGNAYMNIATLTDGATITPNFGANNNFTVTLGGNRTLANATNITAGQSGIIYVVQDSTGSRTLSYGSIWRFPGNTAPTLSTAANAVDALVYCVRNSTSITVNSILNVA